MSTEIRLNARMATTPAAAPQARTCQRKRGATVIQLRKGRRKISRAASSRPAAAAARPGGKPFRLQSKEVEPFVPAGPPLVPTHLYRSGF